MKKALIFLLAFLAITTPLFAVEFSDLIIAEFPRVTSGWSGGIMYRDGKIYECHGKSSSIGVRNAETGQGLKVIPTTLPPEIKDITYDIFSKTVWASTVGPKYHQLTFPGFKIIRTIPRIKYACGLYSSKNEKGILWAADQQKKRLAKLSSEDGRELGEIKLSFPPRGVTQIGSYFWVTLAGEQGDPKGGHLYRVDWEGNIINDFKLPESKYAHDASGLDADGHILWMYGGIGTAIYKLDTSKADGPKPIKPPEVIPTPEESSKDDFFKKLFDWLSGLFG
jgi:glutamine cyclotransferase